MEDHKIEMAVQRMLGQIGADLLAISDTNFIDPDDLCDLCWTYSNYGGKEFDSWTREVGMDAACAKIKELFPKGEYL